MNVARFSSFANANWNQIIPFSALHTHSRTFFYRFILCEYLNFFWLRIRVLIENVGGRKENRKENQCWRKSIKWPFSVLSVCSHSWVNVVCLRFMAWHETRACLCVTDFDRLSINNVTCLPDKRSQLHRANIFSSRVDRCVVQFFEFSFCFWSNDKRISFLT